MVVTVVLRGRGGCEQQKKREQICWAHPGNQEGHARAMRPACPGAGSRGQPERGGARSHVKPAEESTAGWLLASGLSSDETGQGYSQRKGLHVDVGTWTPLKPSSDPQSLLLVALTRHLLSLYLSFPLNQVWLVFYKVCRIVKFIVRRYIVRCQAELVFNGDRVTF